MGKLIGLFSKHPLLAGLGAVVVVVLCVLALWLVARAIVGMFDTVGSGDATSSAVALLFVVGVLALVASVSVIAIKAAVASLLAKQAAPLPSANPVEAQSLVDEVFKAIPGILEKFGGLHAPAMLAVVALASFAGATALVWEKFPDVGAEDVSVSEPPINVRGTAKGRGKKKSCALTVTRDTTQPIIEVEVGTYKVVLRDTRKDIALALTKRGVALARTTRLANGSFSFDVVLEEGALTVLCVRGAKPPVQKPLKVVASD